MGDINMDQVAQLLDLLQGRISSGQALSPEEKTVYDQLLNMAGEGLNLTGTPDFKALRSAFENLANEDARRQYTDLYGDQLIRQPGDTTPLSTNPGSVNAAMERRGISVSDPYAMAQQQQGLKDYNDTLNRNSNISTTNAYQQQVPVRQQNLEARVQAGNLARGAADRQALIGTAGARGGGGGGGGPEMGPHDPITLPLPPGPQKPSLLSSLIPALAGPLSNAALAIGRDYLNKPGQMPQRAYDDAASQIENKVHAGIDEGKYVPGGSYQDEFVPYGEGYNPGMAMAYQGASNVAAGGPGNIQAMKGDNAYNYTAPQIGSGGGSIQNYQASQFGGGAGDPSGINTQFLQPQQYNYPNFSQQQYSNPFDYNMGQQNNDWGNWNTTSYEPTDWGNVADIWGTDWNSNFGSDQTDYSGYYW